MSHHGACLLVKEKYKTKKAINTKEKNMARERMENAWTRMSSKCL
jgi:hypothetical protein